jgi:hypothetical protein
MIVSFIRVKATGQMLHSVFVPSPLEDHRCHAESHVDLNDPSLPAIDGWNIFRKATRSFRRWDGLRRARLLESRP